MKTERVMFAGKQNFASLVHSEPWQLFFFFLPILIKKVRHAGGQAMERQFEDIPHLILTIKKAQVMLSCICECA